MVDQFEGGGGGANAEMLEGVIDAFVDSLREVCHKATLELALHVGRLVIDTFYQGDVTLWRMHGKGHPSLRMLARRHDLPISPAHLYRCVAIYEISHRVPALSTWKQLGMSHVRAVIGLSQDDQKRLLESAAEGRWTAQRLEFESHCIRGEQRSRRGRPPCPSKRSTSRPSLAG
jgi:hypothetical protein